MRKLLLALLFCLLTTTAFATTTETKYVDPGATGAGTGVDWTNAYTSLSAWEAANQANLVTSDSICVVNCRGTTADTTTCDISGWTTNSTHYIQINGDNTTGKASTSYYRMTPPTGTDVSALTISEGWVYINNVEFNSSGKVTGAYPPVRVLAADTLNDEVHLNSCIVHSGVYTGGIRMTSNNTIVKIYNCIVYNCTVATLGRGIDHRSTNSTLVYNTTVYGCTTGFYQEAGTLTLVNCIANACTDNYSGTITTSYSCSDAAGELSGTGDRNGTDGDVTFTNTATDDYSLAVADVNATDLGTSSVDSLFTDDITNYTRTGTWDIGAFEKQTGGTSTSPFFTIIGD